MKMFRDYFHMKKNKKGISYDPAVDIEMFYLTIVGYAMKTIYSENDDEKTDDNTINRIIELYK
jgi:hypothetical protein